MGGIRQRRSFGRTWRALIADAAGLAAMEMALIFPMAVMVMSLIVYGAQAYTVWRKVTLGATTVANLLAQGNNNGSATITAAELSQILEYPSLILYPYNGSTVAVEGSQLLVTVNANGTATGTVCESWANANGTPRPAGQQLSVDPSIASAFSGSGSNNSPICGDIPANTVPTIMSFSARCSTVPADRDLFHRPLDHTVRFHHDDPRTAAEITVQ